MSTDVQSLFNALLTPDVRQPPVATSAPPAAPGARPSELPPAGANAEALNHYRRAFDALSKGDWRTFGVEMEAMQKALQGAPTKRSP